MKLTKLTLVATLLVGSSVFAIENTKFSGDAKLHYYTQDENKNLFNATEAYGQAKLGLGLTTDLSDSVKANANLTVLSTLGMENRIIGHVWEQTNDFQDSFWMDTLNISADLGKTNTKVGRMTLDTPLAWTETWSTAYNTFEAAIVTNKDLADTTILAGYIGGSNGAIESGAIARKRGWVVADMNGTTNFSQFYKGAIIAAVVNNSYKPLTAQAWYYNIQTDPTSVVTTNIDSISSYWLQADYEESGIILGAQYMGGKKTGSAGHADINMDAYAFKLGYEMKDSFSASISYSQTGKYTDGAKNLSGEGYTKLYTESWWSAVTGSKDTQAINFTANAPIGDIFDFGLYVVSASNSSSKKFFESTFEASKSFGNLDASLVYVYTDDTGVAYAPAYLAVNSIFILLTYNF